ncbi:heparin-binding growth factor 2-like protein [Cricetulus griseus]|uniref:Heparin-binding growth factor 2-like protein n=1 Tax=Cricetulus griseus TaxID=10029 RepID=A0A061III0_CRIGR|nr:heparin-binding growth factor 2-like protein [Cricetulus griseus]
MCIFLINIMVWISPPTPFPITVSSSIKRVIDYQFMGSRKAQLKRCPPSSSYTLLVCTLDQHLDRCHKDNLSLLLTVKLQLQAEERGVVSIKGVCANRYLAMKEDGRLLASATEQLGKQFTLQE